MRSITLPPPSEWQAWPKIYEPIAIGDRRRFMISAPIDLVAEFKPYSSRDRATLQSIPRPEVMAVLGLDWLVAQLARWDVSNRTRDQFLATQQLRVWFEPRPYNIPHIGSGITLQLLKVQIL